MMKKIFLIAGEPSGDALGAALMRSLKAAAAASGEGVEFVGIGGDLMTAEGLDSLIPMDEICVMGLWEVIGQLPRLLRLINGVVEEVEAAKPDALVTIDLPDFNFQVAARLKKRGNIKLKTIHYVAPSVWAWRPKRAEKISRFLDGLLCLFPFEPPYFEAHKLPTRFSGHPLVEKNLEELSGNAFREQFEIGQDEKVLGIFFGSRESEFKKMSETLQETTQILLEQYPDLVVVAPTTPALEFKVRSIFDEWGIDGVVVTSQDIKYSAFAACDVGLAVSGTVGLELAYMGVPHVVAYKMHPLTYLIAKQLVKLKYIHLANILLDRGVVPEYIQKDCNSLEISKGLLRFLSSGEAYNAKKEALSHLQVMMRPADGVMPSDKAAAFVFDIINGTYAPEALPEAPVIKEPEPAPAAVPQPKNDSAKGAPPKENAEGAEGVYLPDLINSFKEKIGLKRK